MSEIFRFRAGAAPLLVSMPHVGTRIPEELAARMTPVAAQLDDTDWHVDRLYDFLDALGASVLAAVHSRYVIDLNRPSDGSSLYPGKDTIGLVPLDTAKYDRLYPPGDEPDGAEIARRVERYWKPYHAKLEEELARIRAAHGHALLWDAHSIASVLPRFFEGKLPDLNLGTVHGASCAPGTGERLLAVATRGAGDYRAVLNGRYVGGYITRRYGRPRENVQAVQLELAQCTYMDEAPPYRFREDLAGRLRPLLRRLLEEFLRCAPERP